MESGETQCIADSYINSYGQLQTREAAGVEVARGRGTMKVSLRHFSGEGGFAEGATLRNSHRVELVREMLNLFEKKGTHPPKKSFLTQTIQESSPCLRDRNLRE